MTACLIALFGRVIEFADALLSNGQPEHIGLTEWRRRWHCICGEAVKVHGRYDLKPEDEWICPHCAAPSWTVIESIGRRTWGKWDWKPIPKKE